jgi:hypothetical protein
VPQDGEDVQFIDEQGDTNEEFRNFIVKEYGEELFQAGYKVMTKYVRL